MPTKTTIDLHAVLTQIAHGHSPQKADKMAAVEATWKDVLAEVDRLKGLLREAVRTIRVFHGAECWDIYYNGCPQMKRFRAAIGDDKAAEAEKEKEKR